MVHSCNLSMWEGEVGRSEYQSHFLLYSSLRPSVLHQTVETYLVSIVCGRDCVSPGIVSGNKPYIVPAS